MIPMFAVYAVAQVYSLGTGTLIAMVWAMWEIPQQLALSL
jgi:hypothetical protein